MSKALSAALTVAVALVLSMFTVILPITLPVALYTAITARILITLKLTGCTRVSSCTKKERKKITIMIMLVLPIKTVYHPSVP